MHDVAKTGMNFVIRVSIAEVRAGPALVSLKIMLPTVALNIVNVLFYFIIHETQNRDANFAKKKKIKKGYKNNVSGDNFLHTFASTQNLPVNQFSGSGIKNFLRKWPKTSIKCNFEQNFVKNG